MAVGAVEWDRQMGAAMAECAVCRDSVKARGMESAFGPLQDAVVCEWCGRQLSALTAGAISQGVFQQLLRFAARRPELVSALQQEWDRHQNEEPTEAPVVDPWADMPATSGFTFEGAKVIEYRGYHSAEVVLGVGLFTGMSAEAADLFGTESRGLGVKLQGAKEVAFGRLRHEVAQAGGNAIIGIDLDYTMFGPTLVGVIASGTAVVIDPIPRLR